MENTDNYMNKQLHSTYEIILFVPKWHNKSELLNFAYMLSTQQYCCFISLGSSCLQQADTY